MSLPVTPSEIENCLDILAELIDMGERQYLPLFERLESELAAMERTETVEDRVARRLMQRRGNQAEQDRTAARSCEAA